MTAPLYLIEAEARLDASGTPTTLRFASGTGYNHPSAPGYYEPRLLNPLSLRRTLFASGTTSGVVGVGTGAIDLVNVDGGLDALIGYGFDGGRLTVRLVAPHQPYDQSIILAVLTMEQPEITWSRISLRVRDRLQELENRKIQPNRYAGSNQLPDGLEGLSGDLKGRPKPLSFGRVLNAPLPCVNSSRLIYQTNDGPIARVMAVYDRGAAMTAQADYGSRAEMLATAPNPGCFRAWKAGGYVRLGSVPIGQVTADLLAGITPAQRTAAQLLLAMATGPGGLAPADVVLADVAALDAAAPAELGLWVSSEETVRSTMERVANSVGAWFGFDRLGRLRMRQMVAPAGPPALVLKRLSADGVDGAVADILSIERRPTEDPGRGVPCARVTLTYQTNWTVQESDLAGVVGLERREFLRQGSRLASAEDPSVRLQYRGAVQRDVATLIDDAVAAQQECDRRLALHRLRRDRLIVRVRFDADLAAALDLGATVRLVLPRFGFESGKLFTVIGLDFDAAAGVADLDLWG